MNLKKTFGKLGGILLLSTATSFIPINDIYSQYIIDKYEMDYNGKKIGFYRSSSFQEEVTRGIVRASNAMNIISVEKPNKRILYIDLWGDDLKIDRIIIKENGKTTVYNSPNYRILIEEGQKKFDEYFKIIKEARAKKLLN